MALFVLFAWAASGVSESTDADSQIAGRWLVEKRDAIVLIEPRGDELTGRIVWVEDKDGVKGEERLDSKNPRPDLRSKKVLGLEILSGLSASGQGGTYGGGRIYDPKTGKSYSVKVRLESPDRLKLRVGGSLIGRTTRWTRADSTSKAAP